MDLNNNVLRILIIIFFGTIHEYSNSIKFVTKYFIMKKIIISITAILFWSLTPTIAQDITTVEAKSTDISDNLDLEAVASIFGEAKDLEDFERKLNDPELQISNLDLNGDGQVDYLRVVETSENNVHVVAIQAVIGKDQFQDVAVISVEKDSKGETTVQVVGDVYMYGPDYIIQPVYVHPPVIWVWFWGPMYNPWRSPYYYGYYPPYYRPWTPYPPYRYRSNVHVHVNVNNNYHRTSIRSSNTSVNLQQKNRSNDYARKNPDNSFSKRNDGAKNRAELTKRRESGNTASSRDKQNRTSSGREVQKDWKPSSERNNNQAKPASRENNSQKSNASRTQNRNQPSKKQGQGASKSQNSKPTNAAPAKRPTNQPASSRPASKPTRTPAKQPVKKGGGRR